MPGNLQDYTAGHVEAARRVLAELSGMFAKYRDKYRLVGGWVPSILYPEGRHVGSIDIDLLLNHTRLEDSEADEIQELMEKRGYVRRAEQPFTYYRVVTVNDVDYEVDVDLLAGKYKGKHAGRRTQHIQGLKARQAIGGQFAFEQDAREIELQSMLPNGTTNTIRVSVVDVLPFLCMKAAALDSRNKPKDAYDINFIMEHHPGGYRQLAVEAAPHARHGVVKSMLDILERQFGSPTSPGCVDAADFEEEDDEEGRSILLRRISERVMAFVRALKGEE